MVCIDINITLDIERPILSQDFWTLPFSDKKEVINQTMIDYAKDKIEQLKYPLPENVAHGDYEKLIDLFEIVNDNVSSEREKNLFFMKCAHFMFDVVSQLQGKNIQWITEVWKIDTPKIDDEFEWRTARVHKGTDSFKLLVTMLRNFNRTFNIDRNEKESQDIQKNK